jgi:hypothetical protein
MTSSPRAAGIAGLALAVLTLGAACGGTEPAGEQATTPTTPAAATPAARATTTPPKAASEEVEKYRDITCANWPDQAPGRRTAAASAALDWLRRHPNLGGPAVAAPAPTAAQVAAMVEGITRECAGRQRGSDLIQLTAAAALIYNETADLAP